MAVRERLQTQDAVETPALRPASIPDTTYVRPAEDPLIRISASLGELRPALAKFGSAYIARQNREQAEQVATMPLQSNEEVRTAYQKLGPLSGNFLPPTLPEIAQRKLAGERTFLEMQDALTKEAASGAIDWEKADINQLVYERVQQRAAQFKGDRYAEAGFAAGVPGLVNKITALRTQQATEIDQQRREDNTFAAISQAVDKALMDGGGPDDAFKAARSTLVATAGPNGSQKVPFADADKFMIQKAAQMVASGDPRQLDAAVGLLTKERTGAEGETLPALKDTAKHQSTIDSVIRSAAAERKKQANLAAVEAITRSDTNMISTEQGKLATVGDIVIKREDDTPKVISAKERQTAAVREYVQTLSPAIARANNETPAQTFNRELSNLANAGAEHPQWKSILDSAPQAADLQALSTPAKRDQAIRAANLYDQLREKNPLYLQGLVENKTKQFFEAYRVAKNLPGKTMEEALDLARRASIDISPDREDMLKGHYKTIEQNVSSATPMSGVWQAIFGSSSPVNAGYVQQQVIDTAKLYVRLGLGPDKAIEEAQNAVRDTTTKVNNWVIPKLNIPLPKDFPQAVTEYAEDFLKKHGKLNGIDQTTVFDQFGGAMTVDGADASRVGLTYNGAGTFTLVNENGMALRTPTGLAHFTMKDLRGFLNTKDDDLRKKLLDAADASAPSRMDRRPNRFLEEFEKNTARYHKYRNLELSTQQ